MAKEKKCIDQQPIIILKSPAFIVFRSTSGKRPGHLWKTLVQLSFNWNPWFCSEIKRINYFPSEWKNSIKNEETADDRWIQRTKHTSAEPPSLSPSDLRALCPCPTTLFLVQPGRHRKLNVVVDAGRFPRGLQGIPINSLSHTSLLDLSSSSDENFVWSGRPSESWSVVGSSRETPATPSSSSPDFDIDFSWSRYNYRIVSWTLG